jgi:hypothetical protein
LIIFLSLYCFGVAMGSSHCDEKGMRLESATVPAAVMPDHALRDDGFMKYLPLWRKAPWEGFIKPG